MHQRITREQFYTLMPGIPNALIGLGKIPADCGVETPLVHLIKQRVSQLNGCCFCQHKHAQEARDEGENQQRLDVLVSWRETPIFTPREKAALAWAEALTLLAQRPVEQSVYDEALRQFGETGLLAITAVVLAINSWNRVAVGLAFLPDIS